jgi:hypothetical protein
MIAFQSSRGPEVSVLASRFSDFRLRQTTVSTLLALALATVTVKSDSWEIECIDCPHQFRNMTDRSLRLDEAGYPHVAYGYDHLYYARFDGAEWHFEIADNSPEVGKHAALALDPETEPHVAYRDNFCGGLKYAYKNLSGWQNEMVDDQWWAGAYASLALDTAERAHISYQRYDDLMYAYGTQEGWNIVTVDSIGWAGEYSSIALDSWGDPHISYYNNSTDSLMYAHLLDSVWRIESVDGELGYEGGYTSLALDSRDQPHISYFDGSGTDLKYARKGQSGWETQIVDSDWQSCGLHNSIGVDDANNPHIS